MPSFAVRRNSSAAILFAPQHDLEDRACRS
jgi:hypothetical protein